MQFAGQYQCEVSWRQHWEIGLLDFAAGQREGTSSVIVIYRNLVADRHFNARRQIIPKAQLVGI